ncbi:hypothetical protein INR77_02860 [Erythrobacter sp. SCSIO 43205]|uniref:hypothetical protein n=1 Tax=Erythrobacter sp. SCSIO 43205 TaxID=2779361 RepID=UPI001CA7C7C8|nr:hypothetical protein [Erythrobacter sp. SCSIO 43205]UAB78688.1 hypothetical protein INR77_02860 [Erythrobacter sp. SCSIO 43205]
MNVPFRKSDLALATVMAAGLAVGLGGCTSESESANAGPDDRPESPYDAAQGGDLSGDEIAEAAPGVEDADPESQSPSEADLNDDENLEVAEPDEIDEMREGEG